MQSETKKTRGDAAQLKVVNINAPSCPLMHLSEEVRQESHAAVIKGRLARQRRFEIEMLINRLKEAERSIRLLEKALREVQPHFFPDHPISELINVALRQAK